MKEIIIDETKVSQVMEIIERATSLMKEKDCKNDKEAKKELAELQKDNRIQMPER